MVGLGNPGPRYAGTRHNVGFLVVERLASRWGTTVATPRSGSLTGSARVGGADVVLATPQQYMNRSGGPVAQLVADHGLSTAEVLVVHDEVDLPFSTLRLKAGGGHGGHNGLRDLCGHIGPDFARLRVGIGRPEDGTDTAEHVLGAWSAVESQALPALVDLAADAVERVLRDGLKLAMNHTNQRKRRPDPEPSTAPAAAAAPHQDAPEAPVAPALAPLPEAPTPGPEETR